MKTATQTAGQAGPALRVLREEAGLTSREVARRASVSESYLSRVENGTAEASAAWIANVATAIAQGLVESALAEGGSR